jgi:hypothetical protein
MHKIIAPVIVSLCLIGYFIAGSIHLITLKLTPILTVPVLSISILIAIAVIMVLVERIKEIRAGEADDLSKY